jgi:nucleoid DNA-binding protein
MTKQELVDVIATQSGLNKAQAKAALEATLDSITAELKEGNKVVLTGFGTFEVRRRAARTGTKPGTTEKIKIAAKNAVGFKAGKELKTAVQ